MEQITPLKRPTTDFVEDLTTQLEDLRKTKVVSLMMDPSRSIDRYLVSQVYDMMEKISAESITNLDVILHSGGGNPDAAYHIAKILRSYCKGKLTFIVPRLAKSAATLLCCAGDGLIMGKPAELGPVDPQIFDKARRAIYSTLSIKETLKFLDKIEKEFRRNGGESNVIRQIIKDIPLMEIGDNMRAINHIADYMNELLIEGMFKEDYKKDAKSADKYINEIIDNLILGHYSHSKCITRDVAMRMGLKLIEATEKEWQIIWQIFKSFEQEALIA